MPPKSGGLAQLGERLHGMQEVIGSSPLSSTQKPLVKSQAAFFMRRSPTMPTFFMTFPDVSSFVSSLAMSDFVPDFNYQTDQPRRQLTTSQNSLRSLQQMTKQTNRRRFPKPE